jgi:pimeloyl-ACP methyl ester carboxylesterase
MDESRRSGIRRFLPRIGAVIGVLVIVGGLGYTGYVGWEGSRLTVSVDDQDRSHDCRTPEDQYGWAYEAINYPIEDDARLRAENSNMWECSSQGVTAGTDVVTSDGIRIAGWYIPAGNGAPATAPTVVLMHGWRENKSWVLSFGEALHQQYNLVVFDQRNAGRSSGTQSTMGILEARDLRAIIDWLDRTKHPAHLAVVGDSIGAAAAMGEARDDQRVEALVLESLHTRVQYQFEQRLTKLGHPSYPGTWGLFLGTWLRTGVWFGSADPIDMIADIGQRPMLLAHGTEDDEDLPARTQAMYESAKAAGQNVELQWCDGAWHGGVVAQCPTEFGAWVTDFLARAWPA